MTVTAKKTNLQVSVQGTGAAYAAVTKDVIPNNNGTLKDLTVKVGDTVTAGQKLFTSDSDDLRKTVTTAQNNLSKQNISLQADLDTQAAQAAQAAAAQTPQAGGQNGQSSGQSSAKVDDNKIAMDRLNVSDAKNQLSYANQQVAKMAVTAPIGGIVTVVNNSNGDSVQQSKAVLTIVDTSSMKVKVAVDELDIEKIKQGQKAEVKFDAIKDKTYEGSVETIAQTGTTSNNVTTYDVVVAIKDPSGIKLGMNANVNIQVESKDNALVIPSEAIIDRNGNKFVMVANSDSSSANSNGTNNAAQSNNQQNQSNNTQPSANGNGQGRNRSTQNGQGARNGAYGGAAYAGTSKQVQIKTGMENENYVEVTEGLTEGEKVLVQLPQASSTTNNNANRNNLGGFGAGGFGGGNMGVQRNQSGGNNTRKN
nr:efflux RND transporter periplasmic adaptor subunit [Clostridium rhizosphaerae]